MSKLSILHVNEASGESASQLGPYEIQSLISEKEEGAFTAYFVSLEANQRTATSFHKKAEEIYYILEGSGKAWLDGKPYPLKQGDFVRLPSYTKHSFATGAQGLRMLNIHSPGSRPDRDVFFEGDPPPGFTEEKK